MLGRFSTDFYPCGSHEGTLKRRPVLGALAVAAQQRAIVNSTAACTLWYPCCHSVLAYKVLSLLTYKVWSCDCLRKFSTPSSQTKFSVIISAEKRQCTDSPETEFMN
jgi:hypothetical protein